MSVLPSSPTCLCECLFRMALASVNAPLNDCHVPESFAALSTRGKEISVQRLSDSNARKVRGSSLQHFPHCCSWSGTFAIIA